MASRRHRCDRRRRAGRHGERRGCGGRIPRSSGRCLPQVACLRARSRSTTTIRTTSRTLPTIRLSYPRIAAVAGPCGLWPEDLGPSINDPRYGENKDYYNFGCANQRNLAAMIDNPADLVQPRSEIPRLYRATHGSVREVSQGRNNHDQLSRSRQGQTQRHRQMTSRASQNSEEHPDVTQPHGDDYIAPAPRISAQAFCDDRSDRDRSARGGLKIAASPRPISRFNMGGIEAAIETYHNGADAERHHPGNRARPRHHCRPR